ncbi:MAG: DUF481 domain-containing protein [Candidatus Brocadiaceae bacterium]|nr:DUF481 domain-containing protein [Candidatus Brocadiaceae bacterium]
MTYCLRIVLFLVPVWPCFTTGAYPEEIQTIDGRIIKGEVVNTDKEYLCLRQEPDRIVFIEWRVIKLISRDKEIIIVNHVDDKHTFSLLKANTGEFSARDIQLISTVEISSIYPDETVPPRFFLPQENGISMYNDDKVKTKGSNVAAAIATQQEKVWSGNVDAGFSIKTGNTESIATTVKSNVKRESVYDEYVFSTFYFLEKQGREKSADEQRGTFKYERKHTMNFYSVYQESLEHDEIEKLSLRSISSVGGGYRFINTEKLKYKSEVGPSFTYERFRDNITDTRAGARFGNYLDWTIIPSIQYYFKVDYLPQLEDSEDWRLESDTGMRFAVNKSISLNFGWTNDYDNKPGGEDVKRNDAKVIGTLGYNF